MRALTIGVVLLLATSVYAEDKVEWQKVAPKGSGVEVQFPGKATGKETKAGTQYVLETMGGKGAYLLMTSPLMVASPNAAGVPGGSGNDGAALPVSSDVALRSPGLLASLPRWAMAWSRPPS